MNKKALISVITINYNQSQVTNQLLESLQKVTWPAVEIIVVDNNSHGKDADKINNPYSNVTIVRNNKNLGFAGGNNAGIKIAKGDYILLLNNDTEVEPGFLEPLVDCFEKHPLAGAVSPKIRYYYQPDTIQYAGFTKMNPFTLRMNGIGSGEKDRGQHDKTVETEFAHGCAMMVPRSVIKKVGLMPEIYFLYYEEHDWSTAIRRNGYEIYYKPESLVLHKESISVQKNSLLKTYFINRNRILYMRRNFSWFQKLVSGCFILFVSVPKNTIKYLLASEFKHLLAYRDAIIWNLTMKTKEQWKY